MTRYSLECVLLFAIAIVVAPLFEYILPTHWSHSRMMTGVFAIGLITYWPMSKLVDKLVDRILR